MMSRSELEAKIQRMPVSARSIYNPTYVELKRQLDAAPVEELTPEGVQLVIPGAEKRLPATAKQMELW